MKELNRLQQLMKQAWDGSSHDPLSQLITLTHTRDAWETFCEDSFFSPRISYVCGFLFDHDREYVVLIDKVRPAWQFGKLNGVGGKIEIGESPKAAMIREFREETGANVTEWEPFYTGVGSNFQVHFMRSFSDFSILTSCQTMTDEEVIVCNVGEVPSLAPMANLSWLIPMALDDTIIRSRGRILDGD